MFEFPVTVFAGRSSVHPGPISGRPTSTTNPEMDGPPGFSQFHPSSASNALMAPWQANMMSQNPLFYLPADTPSAGSGTHSLPHHLLPSDIAAGSNFYSQPRSQNRGGSSYNNSHSGGVDKHIGQESFSGPGHAASYNQTVNAFNSNGDPYGHRAVSLEGFPQTRHRGKWSITFSTTEKLVFAQILNAWTAEENW